MNQASCAIDRHQHAVNDLVGADAGTDDTRDGKLAGDDRAVGQDTPGVRDHRRGPGDQRRPGRRGGTADQNLARAEPVRLRHAAQHPCSALRHAAARAQASHHARGARVEPEAGKTPLFRYEIVDRGRIGATDDQRRHDAQPVRAIGAAFRDQGTVVERNLSADVTSFGQTTQFVETEIPNVFRRVQHVSGAELAAERQAWTPEHARGGQLPQGPVFPYGHVGASSRMESLEPMEPLGAACQLRVGLA
jgi:hypothetical protein